MADDIKSADDKESKNVAKGSMTTEKAVLLFYPQKGNVEVKDQVSGQNGNTQGLAGNVQGIADNAQAVMNAVSAETPSDTPYKVFFQFNPASLTINVESDDTASIAAAGSKAGNLANGGQVEYGPVNANVTVNFKVVFDALTNQRAFLLDAGSLSPTNLIRQGIHLASSKSYTVRPIVEFFLAAIRNSSTRRVDFSWGKMIYAGFLKMADCCYTMFDIKGEPVRAEIELSLECGGHDVCNSKKTWQNRYADFMKGREALSSFSASNHPWRSAVLGAMRMSKVEKACIRFHRAFLPEGQSKPENGTQDAIAAGISRLKETIESGADNANTPAAEHSVNQGNAGAEQNVQLPESSEDVYVRVHYNPASITMKSQSGKKETGGGSLTDSSADSAAQSGAMPMKTELSMDLIFDETKNTNAFMMDSGMGSPTGLVRAGLHLKSRMDGREYSVAPISELFVAAMMSSYARQVCFIWNGMEFSGELSNVNVEYMMFNNRGDPIRSRVTISICKSGKTDTDDDFENIWKAVQNGGSENREQDAQDENSEKRMWEKNNEFLGESKNLAQHKGLTPSSGNYIYSNLFRM